MKNTRRIMTGLLLACAASAAHADWAGKGEAGVVIASGNTDAKTANAKLNLTDTWDAWKESIDLTGLRASTNGTTSANRFYALSQTNYALNDRAYWFGALDYLHDTFGSFSTQESATTGLGYKLYDTDKMKLSGQIGVGVRKMKNAVTGDDKTQAVYTAGFNYENILTATTKLVDKFDVQSGSADTRIHNFIGLEVKMATNLALALGYDVTHDTKAQAPRKGTDSLTTANIVFSF